MTTLKQHYFARSIVWLTIAMIISFIDELVTHRVLGSLTTILCFVVWLRFGWYVILFKFKS